MPVAAHLALLNRGDGPETPLAVRDEGEEEQPERQEQRDQPTLDERVAHSFAEVTTCGHH